MNDITLTINSLDLSGKISTYSVDYEIQYNASFTTMDGTERGTMWRRPVITFSLFPMTDAQIAMLYRFLARPSCTVLYTDPNRNADATGTFRLSSNLQSVFGLRSADGSRYYKGGAITLRSIGVL